MIFAVAQLVRGSWWEELMNREVRKPKLAMGSEEDPGTEQDAGAGSWRWADEDFSGDVLEDGVELGKSEEAELWVECVAGQLLSARPVRGPDSGSVLQLAMAEEHHHSQLPALPGCQISPPSVVECPGDCRQVFNPLLKQLFRRS